MDKGHGDTVNGGIADSPRFIQHADALGIFRGTQASILGTTIEQGRAELGPGYS